MKRVITVPPRDPGEFGRPVKVPRRDPDEIRPRVVPPKRWQDMKPWMVGPRPPASAPPLGLFEQKLFKCLANVYNLKRISGPTGVIAHAREAAALRSELETYIRCQTLHGDVRFPRVETWFVSLIIPIIESILHHVDPFIVQA